MKPCVCVVLAACTSAPPHSRAVIIDKLEETIGGPHAIGRAGDFLLENDQVRFVIAGTGVCSDPPEPGCTDVYGRVNTTFGGTLVDADLRRIGGDDKGNDQLAELLPGFAFSVIKPSKIEVTNDGSDGNPAEVTVTGVTDDLFEMVYPVNFGLVGPGGSLDFIQTYKLEPGKRWVTIETTIHNPASGAHPFPYLAPQDLDALTGQSIPGLANLELSSPIGQLPLMGGEQALFAPGIAGFNVRFAIEDTYKTAGGFPAFPGMAVDFLASKGPGVSYGLSAEATSDNYVNTFKTLPSGAPGYPGQDITPYSMLLPFTYAGVTACYMYNPPAQLNANAAKTYTSYFYVGRGDVGSIYDAVLEQRQVATGTFGGKVVDGRSGAGIAGANVIVVDDQCNVADADKHLIAASCRILDQLGTDAGGNFLGHLPPGSYQYVVATDDRALTPPAAFMVSASAQSGAFVTMSPPATVAVAVLDEQGRRAPVKIQLIGHDATIKGIDGRNLLYTLALGDKVRPSAFAAGDDRYIEGAWWTTNGLLETTIRPGTYDVIATRGPEYEIASTTITVGSGAFQTAELQLTRSFDTPGWVAGDFHIHAQPSTDSGLPIVDRVASCAAEGLEVATATDHNFITDYTPVIAGALDPWLLGISGMELTTFEMGHFIGWPLRVDPGSTRGGEFLWAHQPPQMLFDQLRALAIDPKDSVVQVAHPRQQVLGYFAQFFVDQDTALPYTPTGILGVFAPYGDEFQLQNYSTDFDAMELLTGRRVEDIHAYKAPNPLPPPPYPSGVTPTAGQVVLGKDGRPMYPGTVETWFTMLDRGHKATGMGASDSHHLLGDEPGYARTLMFVGDGNDQPGGYSRQNIVDAIRNHHAITTNAPFVTMTTADGHGIGDTVVGASANIAIHVAAATWAPVDTLTIYASNGGASDHVLMTMPIALAACGGDAAGLCFDTSVSFAPPKDGWIVAEVTGTANMFPVLSPTEFPPLDATILINALLVGIGPGALAQLPLTSSLKPIRTHFSTPYAITNPIWLDVDGNGWTPPKSPLPRIVPAAHPRDVRDTFEALPDFSAAKGSP